MPLEPNTPILEHIQGFTVSGFSTRTQNQDEFNEKMAKLPNLWKQFYVSSLAQNGNAFGVYSDYESDANGFYRVTAGIVSDQTEAKWSTVKIQTGDYLVFEGKGPMPSIVVETWQKIWKYFETEKKYKRKFISDFELYKSAEAVAIYIGVQTLIS